MIMWEGVSYREIPMVERLREGYLVFHSPFFHVPPLPRGLMRTVGINEREEKKSYCHLFVSFYFSTFHQGELLSK